jgi:hypothetical protein
MSFEGMEWDESLIGEEKSAATANVRFFLAPRHRDGDSREEGREIAEMLEHVEIAYPGDHTTVFVGVAEERHKRQFSRQYRMWKESGALPEGENQIIGTMLVDWPAMKRNIADACNYLGVYTVEQLAALSDSVIDRIPDGARVREKARSWLASAKDGGIVLKLEQELEKAKTTIARQAEKIDLLVAQVDKLDSKKK